MVSHGFTSEVTAENRSLKHVTSMGMSIYELWGFNQEEWDWHFQNRDSIQLEYMKTFQTRLKGVLRMFFANKNGDCSGPTHG